MYQHSRYAALFLCMIATTANAHIGIHATGSFFAGVTHPLLGVDHVLAMLAVGLWAAQLGGKYRWMVPTLFVVTMCIGAAFGAAGFELPLVETGIGLSVLILGLMVTFVMRTHVLPGALLVALFAFFHGFAHGTEMTGASALHYFIGFVLATSLIHLIGVVVGSQLKHHIRALQASGLLISVTGFGMLLSM